MMMADSQFCLQWNYHNKNICHGLSSLQQSGEFVDMTLAADGHHVKVHQMVLALASPYIKELIATANCPHPVIFLNQVSYKTLCSILEYIYSGQALVSVDDISELLIAAKQLHIKGLEDVTTADGAPMVTTDLTTDKQSTEMSEMQIKLQQSTHTPVSTVSSLKRKLSVKPMSDMLIRKRAMLSNSENDEPNSDHFWDSPLDDHDDYDDDTVAVVKPKDKNVQGASLQYSVSKQGVLKLILNRYIYSADYTYSDGRRHWRCCNRSNKKCKANVVTQGNVVVKRIFNHNHPFHDRMIMRMVLAGNVFGALPDAEKQKQIAAERSYESDTALAEDPSDRDSTAVVEEPSGAETASAVATAPKPRTGSAVATAPIEPKTGSVVTTAPVEPRTGSAVATAPIKPRTGSSVAKVVVKVPCLPAPNSAGAKESQPDVISSPMKGSESQMPRRGHRHKKPRDPRHMPFI